MCTRGFVNEREKKQRVKIANAGNTRECQVAISDTFDENRLIQLYSCDTGQQGEE